MKSHGQSAAPAQMCLYVFITVGNSRKDSFLSVLQFLYAKKPEILHGEENQVCTNSM